MTNHGAQKLDSSSRDEIKRWGDLMRVGAFYKL